MMRFEGLNDEQIQMRKQVAELMAMRRHSMPLLYGDLIPLESSADLISYKRVYLGQAVVVTINRKELTYNISVE